MINIPQSLSEAMAQTAVEWGASQADVIAALDDLPDHFMLLREADDRGVCVSQVAREHIDRNAQKRAAQ